MSPVFETLPRLNARGSRTDGISDLGNYFSISVDPSKMKMLAERLRNEPLIQAAYVKPGAVPAVWLEKQDAEVLALAPDGCLSQTGSFVDRQRYLRSSPEGIDAQYAWTLPGGKGQGVRIIDIEGAWRFSHEDLLQNQGGVIGGVQSLDIHWRNHGTAVVGVLGSDDNGYGVCGIAPSANTRAISIFASDGSSSSARAIWLAAEALGPGDIMLIELHAPGPDANGTGQDGYIAMEWWPDNFAAITHAVKRGILVVEAAGNGARNLDSPVFDIRPAGFPISWLNPFSQKNPQSGAIMVGAGAPPPGTHGRNHGPDRSRLEFSNFGERVDCQGWGREVTTTGYGDIQNGLNEDYWYTDEFSGTSSASPIVVGALACLLGTLRGAGKPLLTPYQAIQLLRSSGSSQTDATGRPSTQRIGNRPNLRQMLAMVHSGLDTSSPVN